MTAKRFYLTTIVAAGLALLMVAMPATAQDGDVRLPGLAGGELTAADLDRGATVLVVWTSWSPRCRDIVARVNALSDRWSSKARIVTVNFQEDRAAVDTFLAGGGFSVPVYRDANGAFARRHAVTTLPGLLVFVDGRVAYSGKLPDDPDKVLSSVLP